MRNQQASQVTGVGWKCWRVQEQCISEDSVGIFSLVFQPCHDISDLFLITPLPYKLGDVQCF